MTEKRLIPFRRSLPFSAYFRLSQSLGHLPFHLTKVIPKRTALFVFFLCFLLQPTAWGQELPYSTWEVSPVIGVGLVKERGQDPTIYGKFAISATWWFYKRWGLEGYVGYSLYEQRYSSPSQDTFTALLSSSSDIPFDERTVKEHKIDLKAMLTYQLLRGEQYTFSLKAGYGEYVLLNSFSDFEVSGPLGGFGVDWQVTPMARLHIDGDLTPNVVTNRTTTSIFGDANFVGNYRILGSWHGWSWGALQFGVEGTVFEFTGSTRLYNGLVFGLLF